jgi:hypothetical protein
MATNKPTFQQLNILNAMISSGYLKAVEKPVFDGGALVPRVVFEVNSFGRLSQPIEITHCPFGGFALAGISLAELLEAKNGKQLELMSVEAK